MYKKTLIHHISKKVIDILFITSIICIAVFPIFSNYIFKFIGDSYASYKLPFMLTIETSGLCCSYILYILKKMYATLLEGNPFTDSNIKHFRKLAVCCFIVFILYIIKVIFAFTVAALVISIIFMVGCLFTLTLKDLFKQAVNYKNENDLTI